MNEGAGPEIPLGSRYRIGELLGRGGMGAVHRGRDIDGTPYAIKVLRPELAADPDVVTRFVRERTILTGVRHPHLVAVHDLVIEGNTLAIVMELVEGGDLRRPLREHGVFAPAQACRIGAGVARALVAAHARDVVHRDVKPENVLLDAATDPASVKLADFGIARLVDGSQLSRTTALIGTPGYLSPEACAGESAVAAGDLYALGVMLYEMCCGVPPFAGELVAVLSGHLTRNPGRPEGIPDPLWNLVARLLSKQPQERPGAAETADRLEYLVGALAAIPAAPRLARPPVGTTVEFITGDGSPSSAVATIITSRTLPLVPGASIAASAAGAIGHVPPPDRKHRRRPLIVLAVAGLALALAGAGGVAVLANSGGSGSAQAGPASPTGPSLAPACDPGRLVIGCQGAAVEVLQARLQTLCFYENNSAARIVDGDFGPKTDGAVRRFQVANGLEPDGVVGPITSAALRDPRVRSGCGTAAPSPAGASPPVGVSPPVSSPSAASTSSPAPTPSGQ
ncbi:MAG: protein kinase domain-containing protein [Sporichthyaceae bacterium]